LDRLTTQKHPARRDKLVRANLANTHTNDLKSWALPASSRARARYRYRCRVSRVLIAVDLIIIVCIATLRIPFIINDHNTDNGNGNGLGLGMIQSIRLKAVDGELPPPLQDLRIGIDEDTLRFEVAVKGNFLRLSGAQLDDDSRVPKFFVLTADVADGKTKTTLDRDLHRHTSGAGIPHHERYLPGSIVTDRLAPDPAQDVLRQDDLIKPLVHEVVEGFGIGRKRSEVGDKILEHRVVPVLEVVTDE